MTGSFRGWMRSSPKPAVSRRNPLNRQSECDRSRSRTDDKRQRRGLSSIVWVVPIRGLEPVMCRTKLAPRWRDHPICQDHEWFAILSSSRPTRSDQGEPRWFEATSQTKPFSDRFCRKTSTGSRSRRSRDGPAGRTCWRASQPGPYVVRVKVPSGVKLMPHRHPEDRIYTVMSGVFYIGLGEQFDGEKVKAYPPGCVVVLPGDTPHFHWAKSESTSRK